MSFVVPATTRLARSRSKKDKKENGRHHLRSLLWPRRERRVRHRRRAIKICRVPKFERESRCLLLCAPSARAFIMRWR